MQYVIRVRPLRWLALVVCFWIFACGPTGSVSYTPPRTEPITEPPFPGDSAEYPQVIQGWLPQYSSFIEAKVEDAYPALLAAEGSRFAEVCPNWDRLERVERRRFWSSLLHSIAGRESNRRRTAIYRESTMSIDRVTGEQIRSEGLLQLSYVDLLNHRYATSPISWEHDREMALADYAAGAKSGNPERTIFNAYANLDLGLFIMNRLAGLRPSESMQAAFGRYWSTMRTTSSSFPKVVEGVKSLLPACF